MKAYDRRKYKLEYFEGLKLAKQDFPLCSGDEVRIKNLIKERYKYKKQCEWNHDIAGMYLNKGYIDYFYSELRKIKYQNI